jgi:long-chain acyl-CoA synthetase
VPEPSQQADRGTLARLINGHASASGDRIALVHGDRRWSYAELAAAAGALATAMGADHLAGERVALLLPNGAEAVLSYLACFAAGAVATPFNSRYAPPEIEAALRRARPRWIVAHADRLDRLDRVDPEVLATARVLVVGDNSRYEPLEPLLYGRPLDPSESAADGTASDAPAVLFFTSGSTGAPKGVVHSQASALAMLTSTSEALDDVRSSDVVQVFEPLVHVSGFIATFTTLMAGGTVTLYEGFDVERYVAALIEHRPTLVCTHIDVLAQVVRAPGARRDWFPPCEAPTPEATPCEARYRRNFWSSLDCSLGSAGA